MKFGPIHSVPSPPIPLHSPNKTSAMIQALGARVVGMNGRPILPPSRNGAHVYFCIQQIFIEHLHSASSFQKLGETDAKNIIEARERAQQLQGLAVLS